MAMAGCASLRGAPLPIIPVKTNVNIAQEFTIFSALGAFRNADAKTRNGMNQKQYRDMVVAIYLNAIDARYQEFRTNISGEGRGAKIGADLAVIGLSTGASLIEKSATDLSAIAAAFAGGRGAVEKNLYFDRTLPALLAAMDSERAKVRTTIVINLRKDENEYPLEMAFGDVASYEAAASIDRAIDVVTAKASAERQIQTVALDAVISACSVPEDLVEGRSTIKDVTRRLVDAKKLQSLQKLAEMVGATSDSSDVSAVGLAIREKLRSHPCSKSELDTLVNKISQAKLED
jgi:hypothetical protein